MLFYELSKHFALTEVLEAGPKMSFMNFIGQCFMIYVVLVVRYGFAFLILYSLVQKCYPVVLGSKTVCWKELKVAVDTLGSTVILLLTLVGM